VDGCFLIFFILWEDILVKKIVLSIVCFLCCLLLLSPLTVSAHPGRTDRNGGHHCWTNCEKWGLSFGQYHYHNGGGNNSKSGSRSTAKKSTPKPQIDEKQVEANRHYKKAKSFYDSGDYKSAIDELEKIYELNRDDCKTDSLMEKSLSGIYRLAKKANKDKDYNTAKEYLNNIINNEHTSDKLKKKAEDYLKEVEENEKIDSRTKAISAKNNKNYDESLKYIQEAKRLGDTKKITKWLDEIKEKILSLQ
jgi:tetratricopeptide (TPR) repeat protein